MVKAPRRMRVALILVLLIQFPLAWQRVEASPNAAVWEREVLVGDNADSYFVYVTRSHHPASYYAYRQTLSIRQVAKVDHSVVSEVLLRDVSYRMDMDSAEWSGEEDQRPSFDLSSYLRQHDVSLAFAEPLPAAFEIGSGGLYVVDGDKRVRVLKGLEVEEQIPQLGRDPRVSGAFTTRLPPGPRGERDVYLAVFSGSASIDDNWSEQLLVVSISRIYSAQTEARRKLIEH